MSKEKLSSMSRLIGRFRTGVFLLLCSSCCFGLCGCSQLSGYSNKSLFPAGISSVCVEMFENQSFRRGLEYELTDALAKRIEAETPYKIISSRNRADSVISGQIKSINQSVLSIERQRGTALEQMLEVEVVVNWKNLRTGELLMDNRPVRASATYSPLLQQSYSYASLLAANNLAEKIVESMETKW